jgi:hypothetical protein
MAIRDHAVCGDEIGIKRKDVAMGDAMDWK